ncbi:endonuclease/exonuclease/phosphatase family protein [Leucobacter manosquensis]|uniref:Endonuclease/exonuclease/phosphatase family protein n=1 Tax=Leucobacter manosquensis TaxID=2810611 RepID=A0ABS5M6S0_9MICO|nr:endonuclease/exonuclease/phosphatase family protein [Leucobacter manosquensis]
MSAGILGDATAEPSPSVRVMTANIRRRLDRWTRRADRWPLRRDRLRRQLQIARPHLLGAQEALPSQTRWVRESLGEGYRFVGHGRGACGGGEGCPVFYDAARLELLDWRQVALSDTPDRAGSRSWGNLIPRVAVIAHLRDRLTSTEFRCINTHLDHLSGRSRLRSLEYLRDEIAAEAGPAILTGDLNTGPGSPALDALLDGGALDDAWRSAGERGSAEYATYANYRTPRLGRRFDWIVTTTDIDVDRVEMLTEPVLGGWPSDHLAVLAEMRIPQRLPTHLLRRGRGTG